MSALYTYSPDANHASFGSTRIGGYVEDTYVEIEFNADAWTKQVGADGEVTRNKSLDKSGTVTVTLMQTSPTNDLFMAHYRRDQQNNGGVNAFKLTDTNGTTVFTAPACWIKKLPNVALANQAGPRVWVFEFAEGDMFVGGATAHSG